jgi:hypothetical protein
MILSEKEFSISSCDGADNRHVTFMLADEQTSPQITRAARKDKPVLVQQYPQAGPSSRQNN